MHHITPLSPFFVVAQWGLVAVNVKLGYHDDMILSFYDDDTEAVWNGVFSRKLPPQIQAIARRKLIMIDSVVDFNDLRIPPANQLEKLHGNRDGQWSIRINKQWRICFVWDGTNASRVEICDYH